MWKNAQRLTKEGGDSFIIQLAALLHDIADWKFHDGSEHAGPERARAWLSQRVERDVIERVCMIIKEVSFKGAGVDTTPSTIEGKIVQDADRLDALGAIGIARAFAFGGHKNLKMYDADIQPVFHTSFEQYKKFAPTINHFYEKLFGCIRRVPER